jgi:hypothetical protein
MLTDTTIASTTLVTVWCAVARASSYDTTPHRFFFSWTYAAIIAIAGFPGTGNAAVAFRHGAFWSS